MWEPSFQGCVVKKPVDNVTLSADEGEALMARVHLSNLPRADAETVEWVIRMYVHVVFARQEGNLSTKRLRSLLFGKPPTLSPLPEESFAASQGNGEEARVSAVLDADAQPETTVAHQALPGDSQRPEGTKPKGGHRPGTGRLGAVAYAGATRVECRHEERAVGQRCPVCGQGTLHPLPAGVEIRIDGNALLSALRYELEKLRGSACGEMFTAGLPEGVGEEKYSAQARAVLAVSCYYLGVPGYRLQGYQAMLGVPVADATQWDQIEVVGDCAYKVFQEMEREAAQGCPFLVSPGPTSPQLLPLCGVSPRGSQSALWRLGTGPAMGRSNPNTAVSGSSGGGAWGLEAHAGALRGGHQSDCEWLGLSPCASASDLLLPASQRGLSVG